METKELLKQKIYRIENKLLHIVYKMNEEHYSDFVDMMDYNKYYIRGFGDDEYSYVFKDDVIDLKIKLRKYKRLYNFYKMEKNYV